MRFYYPHKLYAAGFILLVSVLIYGIIILYDINVEGNLPALFLPFYGLISILFGRFYIRFYLYYRKKFIDVYMDHLEFCSQGVCLHIEEEEILGIYLAKHRQLLKVYRIIHIFTKDGTYVHITNEVNRYNRLIMLLKYYYPSQFKICKSVIGGVINVDINLLEAHLRENNPR